MYFSKYEIVADLSKSMGNKKLFRIRALRDFGQVRAGQLGGYIEAERNLSHDGNAWIYDNAVVRDEAQIDKDAEVHHFATVKDNAKVSCSAKIFGYAAIFNRA